MLDKNLSSRSKVFVYLILLAIASLLIIPFLYMISIALASPESNIKQTFSILPTEFYFSNFIELFKDSFSGDKPVGLWFLNSMMIVILSIVGQIFSSTMVAYGFARLKYKHKNKYVYILSIFRHPSLTPKN